MNIASFMRRRILQRDMLHCRLRRLCLNQQSRRCYKSTQTRLQTSPTKTALFLVYGAVMITKQLRKAQLPKFNTNLFVLTKNSTKCNQHNLKTFSIITFCSPTLLLDKLLSRFNARNVEPLSVTNLSSNSVSQTCPELPFFPKVFTNLLHFHVPATLKRREDSNFFVRSTVQVFPHLESAFAYVAVQK